LIQTFCSAIHSQGGGRILITDTEAVSASSFVADASYPVPYCSQHELFIQSIIDICNKEHVSAIIPLRCVAVETMPLLRDKVDAVLITGDDDSISICCDKLATHDFLIACGLRTPAILLDPRPEDLPVFFRPRHSEGSQGVCKVTTPAQLAAVLEKNTGIFTTYIQGTEFTVDCYKNLSGDIVALVPRERLRVRAGEVEKAVTRHIPHLEALCSQALSKLNFVGPATIQAIYSSGYYYFTEINLRYGGGVTLSIAAGMHSPTWLLAELQGLPKPILQSIKWGMGMCRYDEEFYFQ
jgi:carbamoyl-phosphate synthase large subunit